MLDVVNCGSTSYRPKFYIHQKNRSNRGDMASYERTSATVPAMTTVTLPSTEAKSKFSDTAISLAVHAIAPFRVLRRRPDITLIAQVRELGTLSDEWRGPESIGPQKNAVNDAETFIRMYYTDEPIAKPSISAASDGEINFYWKTPLVRMDLSIFGDATYSYFARTIDGRSFRGDNIPVYRKLPDELIILLK